MAYSTADSPYLLVECGPTGGLVSTSTAVTAGFANIYALRSTEGTTLVIATNYITNATALGMKKYDIVAVLNEYSTTFSWCMVNTISSGYATLSIVTTG